MIIGFLTAATASAVELFITGFTLGTTLMTPILIKKQKEKYKNERGGRLWSG